MTDFESVGDYKDELLFDLLKDEEENVVNDQNVVADAVAGRISVCVICRVSTDLEILFVLCRHLNMCNDCYRSFLASIIAEQTDQRANKNDDDDYRLECPMCRVIHKPSQIMNVFKPWISFDVIWIFCFRFSLNKITNQITIVLAFTFRSYSGLDVRICSFSPSYSALWLLHIIYLVRRMRTKTVNSCHRI